MKVSDYIVEYIIEKGIGDVFGYPGGMVTHLMDSLAKYDKKLCHHVTYHEQAAAFAACGYAQASGKTGVAYATSGPGATNLLTGVCNAFFDSIPTLFITGQVNTGESKQGYSIRQRGFQETDIVSIASSVTKYAAYVDSAEKIKYFLDRAFYEANEGRKGPSLLDIPMNIFRAEIDPDCLEGFEGTEASGEIYAEDKAEIKRTILRAKRPVLIVGSGIKTAGLVPAVRKLVADSGIPVVSSMLAADVVIDEDKYFGFIGAYGERSANFIVAKSDLVICLGARMDIRQVGVNRANFAPNAQIIRFDIDENELAYKLHEDDITVLCQLKPAVELLTKVLSEECDYSEWKKVCIEIKEELDGIDDMEANLFIKDISRFIDEDAIITTDVGQNQVWVPQSMKLKGNQQLLFSGGHGAMGYSLPAAIGACLANGKRAFCFTGDGGFQMNIQELQFVAREQLPVKIILFNNSSLGMIRHFQEMYFDSRFTGTLSAGGYSVPDFGAITKAYGIKYTALTKRKDIKENLFAGDGPELVEIVLSDRTYVKPKLEFGKPNQDQEPLLNRELYNYLMGL